MVGQEKFGKKIRSFVMKTPEKIIFPIFDTEQLIHTVENVKHPQPISKVQLIQNYLLVI